MILKANKLTFLGHKIGGGKIPGDQNKSQKVQSKIVTLT